MPVTVGVSGVIAWPTIAEIVVCEYKSPLGATGFTVNDALPASAVSSVEVAVTVAVPADIGVKTPALLTVPAAAGLTDHVTDVLKLPVPVTVAEQAEVPPVEIVAGEQTTATFPTDGGVLPLDELPPQPVIDTTPENKASTTGAIRQRIHISILLCKTTQV